MTASDIAEQISKKLKVPGKDARILVRSFFSSIVLECVSAPRLELRGFGTFSAVRRRPRPARNFKTGRPVMVPDRLVLKFKAGKEILARFNPLPLLIG